jgi:putative DNA primase/helicase
MKYDGPLSIATGMGAKSKIWKNQTWQWSQLVSKLQEEYKTNETFKEFIAANKEDQGKIKDVGGYVGGYLRNGRRKPENVINRQILTLDVDFAHLYFWDDFTLQFSNAAVLHGTHKHCEASPRYRLVVPLSREVSPDEYVAIARRLAGSIDIELFDNTTFETNRLMFWPSSPKDVDYYCKFQDGPWLDADEILNSYADWRDSSLWPTSESKFQEIKDKAKKQQDPEEKKGLIGAFCRAYSITEAIEILLTEDYEATTEGRYTYKKGSTASGLITYEDKFAFSHHGTDPSGGKLCNAFDLVRIHKFGHLDADLSPNVMKLKSFKAMEDFCRADDRVRGTLATENVEAAKYDFAEDLEEDENFDWMKELEIDARGNYISSANNLNVIFANDKRLKGLFKQNEFDGKKYVFGNMPWRRVSKPEVIKNVDYSGVRNYIESIYGITGNLKIEDSMALEFEKSSFHPVREYLERQVWDCTPRVDSLLIDYFGVSDNLYTREAIRKTLTGAVARIFDPGVKFDLVLTLVGPQGTGKSTFINRLGYKWFSDTFMTVQGKEALEQIQGAWIIEMAELSGLKKAEVEAVKHFISKQEDTFRPAYARTSETYPRQCIFMGSTNNKDFLRDPSGNRRFLPIDINKAKSTKEVFHIPQREIDQMWAEAVQMYKAGEKLYLSIEAEILAGKEQKRHSESDERIGLIERYLDTMIPENWGNLDIYQRRDYLRDSKDLQTGTVLRDYICVAEVWTECLEKPKEDMDRYKTREINDILKSLEDWEQSQSTKNFKIYGKQKYYLRKLS